MAFTLEHVVPWGRSFSEYQRMFSLTEDALKLRILGCADGPAGFNVEATRRGAQVVSVDPLYAFSASEIRERIRTSFPVVLEQTRKNASDFVWNEFASVDDLGRARTQTMEEFLADFDAGRQAGRYVSGQLPRLPFEDHAFDLALARISCFCTRIISTRTSTSLPSWNCAASPARCASFPCLSWAVRRRFTSAPSRRHLKASATR